MAEINGTVVGETLEGTNDADVINGNGGVDIIYGYDGDDTLLGGEETDTFTGGNGDDFINGRFGNNDVARFAGNRSNYAITNVVINGLNHVRVTGLGAFAVEGTDTLLNIEIAQFADISIQLGINPNNRPIFGQPTMVNQTIVDGGLFGYQIPGTAFIDLDQDDVLSFRATLSDGSLLPAWLTFNAATRTFSGTPPLEAIGTTYVVRVYASDDDLYDPDYEISSAFSVTVNQAAGADIVGTDGDDVLSGTFRSERMSGGMGNDLFYGSAGVDWINGGGSSGNPGNYVQDRVDYSASGAAVTVNLETGVASGGDAEGDFLNQIEGIIGSAFADNVIGTLGSDWLWGGLGEDLLNGSGGDDRIFGEGGNDVLDGGNNNDRLAGGAGNDNIIGGSGADVLFSGEDSPNFTQANLGYNRTDLVFDAGVNADQLLGGDNNDVFFIGFNDSVDGGGEDANGGLEGDSLYVSLQGATSGVNVDFRQPTISLGTGQITNIEFVHFVEGSNFDDRINMTENVGIFQFSTVHGMGGNDRLIAGFATAAMYGDDGADVLDANGASFYLRTLSGGAGDDHLHINAYSGALILDGGDGYDTLYNRGLTFFSPSVLSVSSIEAIVLEADGHIVISGAQFASGFTSNLALSGIGTVTVNMVAGVNFVASGMSFTSTVATVVNGTSGIDIIKLGLGSSTGNTVNSGDGVDQIRGSNGVDAINGGDGNDKIMGIGGADTLTGGTGNDQFRYFLASDSGFGAAADRITDYAIGSDRLNFALLDTNPGLAGVQGFAFVGNAAFSGGGAASIRYTNSGADLLVQADINGDGIADMEIILQGLTGGTLTAADFIL